VIGIEVTAQATQGPTRNIILIERGHTALGLITRGIGWEVWNGTGEWTGAAISGYAGDPANVRLTLSYCRRQAVEREVLRATWG
jgi:NMT1-like family